MLSWNQFVRLSEEDLATHDVADINLACAEGLPGSEKIDVVLCRDRLDYYARRVREYTEPRIKTFQRKPHEYNNSEGYFRILVMITVLQRDLGVRYNPAKSPEDVPLTLEDTFIHGIIQGEGGTCNSLPVVYVAVGRRLGYPLKADVRLSPLVRPLGRS